MSAVARAALARPSVLRPIFAFALAGAALARPRVLRTGLQSSAQGCRHDAGFFAFALRNVFRLDANLSANTLDSIGVKSGLGRLAVFVGVHSLYSFFAM
jgi:hypothetical protein